MANNHLQPHDKFFRSVMENPRVAQEFFEQHLPNQIRKVVNLDQLQLQKESFIDDQLKSQITDMLYATEFSGEPGYLYLLVEHQSTADDWIAFRILKYMVAIMDHHIKKTKSNTLPIVYPIIFYTGKNTHHPSTDFLDLFGSERTLAEDILSKPYQLIDVSKISDEKLKEYLLSGMMARIMKNIYLHDIVPFLKTIIEDLREVEKRGEMDYIYDILKYMILAGEVKDKETFINTAKAGLTELQGEKIMTIAELFKQEGMQKGREEMARDFAKKLLAQNMSIEQIVELTELSRKEVEKLKIVH